MINQIRTGSTRNAQQRRMKDLQKDLEKLNVTGCESKTSNREAWMGIVKDAMTSLGL